MSIIMALLAVSYRVITVVTSAFGGETYRHRVFVSRTTILKRKRLLIPLIPISTKDHQQSFIHYVKMLTLFSHTMETCCIGCNMSKNIWFGCSLCISLAHSMHKYSGGGVSLANVMDMQWSKQTLAASALPALGHMSLWHTKGWASPKKYHVHNLVSVKWYTCLSLPANLHIRPFLSKRLGLKAGQ